jgi:hypothetical protein
MFTLDVLAFFVDLVSATVLVVELFRLRLRSERRGARR